MRPVLASNDRNGFIVEAREMKKVNNDRIGVEPRPDEQTRSFARYACRSGPDYVVMEEILSIVRWHRCTGCCKPTVSRAT